MTQPLSLGVHPCTTASHAGFHTLCQAFGCADEMGQVALPEPFPGLIEPRAITDQDTSPVVNKLDKCHFGTGRVYLKVCHVRVRHDPQPLPITMHEPRRLVNV